MKVIRRCFFFNVRSSIHLEKRTYDIALYCSVNFIVVEDGCLRKRLISKEDSLMASLR